MSGFTEKEVAYLKDQRLGRLATVDAAGRPHVVPVAFRYDPEFGVIDVGGYNMARSKKYRDAAETGLAAFVVDDVAPGGGWQARGVEVRGRAEVLGGEVIRVIPERIVGWGLDSDAYAPNARSVGG